MSTINVGSALPAGTNTIGNVKVVDSGGTNQVGVDANNNLKVSVNQAANQMGVDSSNNAHVGLWNGTNQAVVDSSGNQAVKGGFTEQASLTSGSLNADLVASTEVSAYKWFALHINTNAYSGTLTFQASNDNTNWTSIQVYNPATGTQATTTGSTNTIYTGAITFRYLRVRMTAYISGTAQGTLELYTSPGGWLMTNVYQAGNWNVNIRDTSANSLTSTSNALDVNLKTSSITLSVTPQATTTGGATFYHLISAATTNATSLKASAGLLYGFEISNTNASPRYVRFYNLATAPTVGTSTVAKTVQVPGNSTIIRAYPVGLTFGTGIAFAATGAMADNDTTAIGAADLSIDIDYK